MRSFYRLKGIKNGGVFRFRMGTAGRAYLDHPEVGKETQSSRTIGWIRLVRPSAPTEQRTGLGHLFQAGSAFFAPRGLLVVVNNADCYGCVTCSSVTVANSESDGGGLFCLPGPLGGTPASLIL
jgi:hypothetical protein